MYPFLMKHNEDTFLCEFINEEISSSFEKTIEATAKKASLEYRILFYGEPKKGKDDTSWIFQYTLVPSLGEKPRLELAIK